jgi:hypothetical protein
VRPLVEANERQAARLEEMAEEIGTLKERLRSLEASQPLPQPAPAPVAPAPVDNSPMGEIAPEPVKKRHWWQF